MRLATCAAAMAVASGLAVPAATNTTAAAMPWCGADSLSISAGPPISPDLQQQYLHFHLFLTNVSEQACTMQGYPGVDFLGPDDPMLGGPIIRLARTEGDVQPVVLAPGASASSLLGFVPKTSDVGFEPAWPPTTIVVTPPDSTTQLKMPWPSYGFTIQQIGDGTTHAATVGPLSLY